MYSEIDENRFLEVTYANGDKEVLYFKDFNSRRDDPEHRRPGQEDGDQGLPHDRRSGASGSSTCSRRASTSSRRTRTCPTRPTPTTGPASPARRASGSSTSARSSPARTAPSRAARSTTSPTPASTSRPHSRVRCAPPALATARQPSRQGTAEDAASPRGRTTAPVPWPVRARRSMPTTTVATDDADRRADLERPSWCESDADQCPADGRGRRGTATPWPAPRGPG